MNSCILSSFYFDIKLFYIQLFFPVVKLSFFLIIFLYHKILQDKVQNIAKYYNDAKFSIRINYIVLLHEKNFLLHIYIIYIVEKSKSLSSSLGKLLNRDNY